MEVFEQRGLVCHVDEMALVNNTRSEQPKDPRYTVSTNPTGALAENTIMFYKVAISLKLTHEKDCKSYNPDNPKNTCPKRIMLGKHAQ